MKRLAFNGGEISPAMALRCDMDPFARSCTSLLNWEVAPTGGITRRRGMRPIADAAPAASRLFPFTYSTDLAYLVEVSADLVTVRDTAGQPLQSFESTSDWQYADIGKITYLQLNSILLLLSPECQPMQLQIQADYSWTFKPFAFKNPPWHSISPRDHAITLTPSGELYTIAFDDGVNERDADFDPGDILRASYYTERQEASASSSTLRSGNWKTFSSTSAGITNASSFNEGDKIAIATEPTYELFVCTRDFTGSNDFTNGCTSPANYSGGDQPCFMRADDATGFDEVTPITALTSASTYKKGDKIKLRSGYWKLYYCIKTFTTADYIAGKNSPTDYPAHFCYGIPVGEDALTCRGTWKFHCSGTWFGSYEIRRSYTKPELTALWETLGESLSLIGQATNNIITGNEEEDPCYLRLFLTSVRYINSDVAAGWPPDECGNCLVVSSYKHDMHLTAMPDGLLQDTSPVQRPLSTVLTTDDWSWCAFNGRYGYPALAALHESRLVLAATSLQPQTIWLSRTDDLDNFAAGATDNAALHLTMTTQTQAAICWLTSRGSAINLGTEDGEWVIQSTTGGALTPNSARIVNHGRIGSAHIPAVAAADRLLYCERGAGRLYQFAYDYTQDAFTSQDLTIFADHILQQGGGITGGTILRKPFCTAVFTLADGTLALMSYNTHHNVNAWHRWATEGHIDSVCALPNGNNADNLYLIVDRGGTRSIELVNADSPFIDGDGLDYLSEMETTAFTILEADERKIHLAELKFYLTSETPAESVTLRTARADYSPIARRGILPTGWVTACTLSGWSDRPLIGIHVRGDTPCSILAVQL